MTVAMVAVRKVQVAIDEVADVIPMRDSFVPALRPMDVALLVASAFVIWRATHRIRRIYLDDMLVDVAVVHMVKMAIVEVVDVVAMAHGCMTAPGTVDVGVVCVLGVCALAHALSSKRVAERASAITSSHSRQQVDILFR